MKESVFAILKYLERLISKRAGLIMGMTLTWGLLTLDDHEYLCSNIPGHRRVKRNKFFTKEMSLL